MTTTSSSPTALVLAADASVVQRESGEVHCRVGDEIVALDGAAPELVRSIFAACDGVRERDAVQALVAARHGAAVTGAVIDALIAVGALTIGRPAAPAIATRVVVLGNHLLLGALDRALADAGYGDRTRVALDGLACLESVPFKQLILAPHPQLPAPPADRVLADADAPALEQVLAGFELAVCALEGLPYRAQLEVNGAALAAGTPCLFITPDAIGPLVVRGGPCFACRLRGEFAATDAVPWFQSPASDSRRSSTVTAIAIAALAHLAATDATTTVSRLAANGCRRERESLLPRSDCPACKPRDDGPFAAAIETAVIIGRTWPVTPQAAPIAAPDAYRTVGIVGGGTAGYLTALALRRLRPELRVTLIESSKIPVIGVGEATTPELVKFLHAPRFLDRDVADLWRRVQPTWKLGIRFAWGPRDFSFPFQRGRLLESKVHDGHLDHQSLAAMLMAARRSPVFRDERGGTTSLVHLIRWAYHLENRRFVRYLHEEALAAGVELVDAEIVDVPRTADDGDVAALVLGDGRRLDFDLYVDCSGFRSLLLGRALGVRFIDWSSTLFNDRAVVASVSHDGTVKPYTLAETMDAGWCWNIPFEDEDHRGYVFSSRFLDPERAEAEMRAKNPGMGEAGLVKFRSGRHAECWRGNVVAIGNAYGFVEPLESTAIHMIVQTLELLTTHFPASRHDRAVVAAVNRKVAGRWDALRAFLGIHFRFNRREDTPYWRAANHDTDIGAAAERVALFRERAPLSYGPSLAYTVIPPDFFADDHSYDTLLMGQDVPARYVEPVDDLATWERLRPTLLRMTGAALPQAEALRWLRDERPDELARLKLAPDSWLGTHVPA